MGNMKFLIMLIFFMIKVVKLDNMDVAKNRVDNYKKFSNFLRQVKNEKSQKNIEKQKIQQKSEKVTLNAKNQKLQEKETRNLRIKPKKMQKRKQKKKRKSRKRKIRKLKKKNIKKRNLEDDQDGMCFNVNTILHEFGKLSVALGYSHFHAKKEKYHKLLRHARVLLGFAKSKEEGLNTENQDLIMIEAKIRGLASKVQGLGDKLSFQLNNRINNWT